MNDIEITQNSSTDQKDEKLKSFIERIERLEEEKNNIMLDIKEVLSEAKTLYLKETANKSFDLLNLKIFTGTKNTFITRILKKWNNMQ